MPAIEQALEHFVAQLTTALAFARIADAKLMFFQEDGSHVKTFLDELRWEVFDVGLDMSQ